MIELDEAVRNALEFEKISVVGMPALAYAMKYPERLDRLVMSSAPFRYNSREKE
jgi:pimeloyl-ACP methyl ester carboxylesterase